MLKVRNMGQAQQSVHSAPQQSNISVPIAGMRDIKLELRRAMFVAVPGENPVHYRPMIMTFTDYEQQRIQDITENGLKINHAALAEVARDIIAPSRQSQGEIGIANDWTTQRFSVFLEFQLETPHATEFYIFTGYTDHLGLSERLGHNSHAWDPDMQIFLNSYMKIREIPRINSYQSTGYQVNGVNQILRPSAIRTPQGKYVNSEAGIGLRPYDTMTAIQRNEALRSMGRTHAYYDGNKTRGEDSFGLASSRKNELSSQYLSGILKTYSQAKDSDEDLGGARWTYGTAASYLKEDSMDANIVFTELKRHTSHHLGGSLTMRELESWFPYFHSVVKSTMPERGAITSYTDYSESWGRSTGDAIAAYALSHTVPAALTPCMCAQATFVATNRTPDGQIDIMVPSFSPIFETDNDTALRNGFMDTLRYTVLPEVFDHETLFEVEMECSLFGISTIKVSINGEDWVTYRAPNYADGITSSLIATNEDMLDDVAGQAESMLETVFNPARCPDPGFATRRNAY